MRLNDSLLSSEHLSEYLAQSGFWELNSFALPFYWRKHGLGVGLYFPKL